MYNNYATTRPGVPVPAAAYFDWSAPMVPFSILMAYIHVVVFYFLLKIIDVRSGGGKVSDNNNLERTSWFKLIIILFG